MTIKEAFKKANKALRSGPLWQGPEGQGLQGGITQSMIARWLSCRVRFAARTIEGWKGNDQFSKALEYGNMWHICEEKLAASPQYKNYVAGDFWLPLQDYCKTLYTKYPTQQDEVDHWYRTCKAQFPCYVAYWAKHPDVEQRTPLMQEQVFDVPYELPSGRVVRLRGKLDSVDLIGKGKSAGIYLMENKTKGAVDQAEIQSQLLFDLQTMTYLVALQNMMEYDGQGLLQHLLELAASTLAGVRYNVIRRPFSGGRGSIKRNPAKETKDQFYQRLTVDYFRAEPEYWFMRWKSEVSPADVKRFRDECLDPLLEALCWWYERQVWPTAESQYDPPDFHWRHPYGVHNYVDEGYGSDVDRYIETGSTVGLVRNDNLFPELS